MQKELKWFEKQATVLLSEQKPWKMRGTSYGKGMSLRECEVSGDRLGRDGVDEAWRGPDRTDQLRG